jgi:hypothetical protein
VRPCDEADTSVVQHDFMHLSFFQDDFKEFVDKLVVALRIIEKAESPIRHIHPVAVRESDLSGEGCRDFGLGQGDLAPGSGTGGAPAKRSARRSGRLFNLDAQRGLYLICIRTQKSGLTPFLRFQSEKPPIVSVPAPRLFIYMALSTRIGLAPSRDSTSMEALPDGSLSPIE